MIDTEIVQDYSSEARELLDEMDSSLMKVEKEGATPELLNTIFRAVHCIKGSAEYIGLERSSTLTHGVENLLDRVREGVLQLTPQIIDFLFRSKDLIALLIQEVAKHHEERSEISGMMAELEQFISQREHASAEGLARREPAVSEVTEAEQAAVTAEGTGPEARSEQAERELPSEVPAPETQEDYSYEQFRYEIGDYAQETADLGSTGTPTAPTEELEPATSAILETEEAPGLEPEGFEKALPLTAVSQTAESDLRTTLGDTVPHVLNISLYLDDLQDGLNPADAISSILSEIENFRETVAPIHHDQIHSIVDRLARHVASIDSDLGPVTPDEIEDLRVLLQDLRPYYPEDLFPMEATKATGTRPPARGKEPAKTDAERSAFVRQLAAIPDIGVTVAEAIADAGFLTVEQIARADWESLKHVSGLRPAMVEAILMSAGIPSDTMARPPDAEGPSVATGRSPVPRTSDRSLLADVDDELLKAFEGIFGDITAGASVPSIVPSADDNPAADMLAEVGIIEEEADREIIEIFMSYGWEVLDKLRPLVAKIAQGSVELSDLNRCAELIKSVRSSSSYMDYQRLAAFLDEWYEKTLWSSERTDSLSPKDVSFMHDSLTQFHDFLAGLEIALKPEAGLAAAPHPPIGGLASVPPQVQRATGTAMSDAGRKGAVPPGDAASVDAKSTAGSYPEESPTRELERALQQLEKTRDIRPGAPASADRGGVTTEDLGAELVASEGPLPSGLTPESALVKTMRVDSGKVDALLNQVGELVVNRSFVEQLSVELKDLQRALMIGTEIGKREIQAVKDLSLKVGEASLSLGRVANDIQEGVMKLRMLPVGQLFNRMPRLIRDLSRRVGKVVELEVYGGDTEVDKRVIEQIYNPLVHLIRNAVDHGIEDVASRRQSGKKEEGTITLRAYSQGNQVVIDVEDDGAGIDTSAVVDKAVEDRLIDAQEAKSLAPQDVFGFLFVPGFSTSKKVTRTSGRGVGMDVVKKDVEKINGHVEIESWENLGTRVSIRIPLTLAIIQTLLVRVAKHVFAIPLTSVREIIQISLQEIITIEGFEVIKFREETIPVLRFNEVFNMELPPDSKPPKFLVLAIAGTKTVGLLVEDLIGEQDVVIKPLAEHVCHVRGLAGSTILGDGTISLVLDVTEMIDDMIAQQRQLALLSPRFGRPSEVDQVNRTM